MKNEFINPAPIPSTNEQPKTPIRPRPIRTYYYHSPRDKADEWARLSHACTLHNAARAALMKLLKKDAMHADFYDEDGVRIGWMTRKGNRIVMMVWE